MREKIKNWLYMLHAIVVWIGSAYQIHHVYTYKSAEDLTLVWVACLTVSELAALPRALGSCYCVWKACHVVATVLLAILLVGVILYG